jgi:serine/threonine-protein kinase
MPKVTTTEKLIELVKRSGLVSNQELAGCLADQARSAGGILPADSDQFADRLVQAGLMTRWQVDQLLKGKYRGFRLGKYTLKGHLGTGGMSSVYLSEHPIMRRPVAIKVLPKARVSKSSYLERFELEARAVAALDHPNIVRAYDIDNEGDTHYIVMEYVEGRDFQRMVEQDGPVGYERAADYIAQAAVGLQHAHEAGVVHRDIKPANCLVDKTGTVKVLDMGLAKFAADETSLSAIHKDSVVGTADYLAPEQAVNSSRVDARADVYGLGGTLYFLLTGHPPFPQGTLTERLLKHQKEEPASIYQDRPDAPPALVDICRRMMMKRAAERIQSAADVATELRHWLTGRGYGPDSRPATSSLGGGRISSLGVTTSSNPASASDRWRQLATPPRPSGSSAGRSSDTVSGAHSDTGPMQRNEDLTLAPIEDESPDRSSVGLSSTGKSDVTQTSPSDLNLDEQVLSRIEEEIGGESTTSGSLVDLLEDRGLSNVSTSGVVIRRPKEKMPTWVVVAASVGGALLFVLLIVLLVVAL